MEQLILSVRGSIQKPTGYRVFYGSGLNAKDVRSYWKKLSISEQANALQLYNKSFKTSAHGEKETEDDKLLAMFNALLESASNVSHVSNAYSEDITAIFTRGPIPENNLSQVPITLPHESEISDIESGSYLAKNRKHGMYGSRIDSSYSPLEYLTVVAANGKVLAANKPVLANHSYIVTKEGHMVRQKYGEPNKFVDESGRAH